MAWVQDAAASRYTLDTVAKQQLTLPTSGAFSPFPATEVMRAFQVDALTTQWELVEILRSSLLRIFDIPPLQAFRFAYQEELQLGLEAVLYRFSTMRLGQSVGDRLQNLVMRDEKRAKDLGLQSSAHFIPSLAPHRRLLLVHAVCSLLVPYLVRKVQRKSLEEDWSRDQVSTWKQYLAMALRYATIGWSALSLINTFYFLATGRYRTLLERLLSIKVVYGTQTMQRFTNLLYLNQHMWWHTWASLFAVLNVGRYLGRLFRSVRAVAASPSSLVGSEHACCACREVPTISQRSNCGHLYCYYCIKSRLLDRDGGGSFRCYACGQTVHTCGSA